MKSSYFSFFMIFLCMSFALAQVPPPVPPSQYEWTISGTTQNQQLGGAVAGIVDVNGDGANDIAIGAASPGNPPSSTPRVTVHDGLSGQIIYTILSPILGTNTVFGAKIAGIGDVNGDVYQDIAILSWGAFNGGGLYVYSGQTGTLLWSFVGIGITVNSYGSSLIGIPDVNGNNIPDIALLISNSNAGSGTIRVFDGAGTSPLYTVNSPIIGSSLAKASDVDGDGINDFVSGGLPSTPSIINGIVSIYSGATGSLISSISDPTSSAGYFGRSVSSTDLNNDGLLDIIVGEDSGLLSAASNVYVISLSGGQTYIQTLNLPTNFVSVAGLKDADGDGYGDILVGSGPGYGNTNQVRLYSGQTGGLINTFIGPSIPNTYSSPAFGAVLADAGDINGDGLSDIVIGDHGAQSSTAGQSGRAFVYRLGGVRNYGTGSLTLAWNPQAYTPSIGQFTVFGAQPNSNGIMVMSLAPAYTPLSSPLTPLFIDLNSPNPIFTTQIQFDNNGFYTSPVYNIRVPSIAGTTVYIQVANTNSAGNILGLTNAAQATYVA